jgi:phosphopantothenoylcysteine decarboxylase/phosphopantothenate--cysteine ligase
VRKIAPRKIKKTGSSRMTLELVENPDILKGLGERKGDKTLVGFALETEDLEANAIKKLMAKNLDLLVANRKALSRDVFGPVRTRVLIVDRFGNKRVFSNRPKSELAKIILDKVASLNIY